MFSKMSPWYFFVLGNTILEQDGVHFQDINKTHTYNLTSNSPQDSLILTQNLLYPVLTEVWEL